MKLNRQVFLFLLPYTLIHSHIINVSTNTDTKADALDQVITNSNSDSNPINTINCRTSNNIPEIGVKTFEKDRKIFTLLVPQIILPIKNKNLSNNEKQVANYLFFKGLDHENKQFVDLLHNLVLLPIKDYEKALASFTPEIYGALPLSENQTIHYLTNLSTCSSITNEKNTFAITPFYHTSYYDKENFLPKYQNNAAGFSITTSHYTTFFTPGAGLTYCRSDTVWEDKKGKATTFNMYLYPSMNFHKENLFCNVIVLGGYTYHNVMRGMQFVNRMEIDVNPHSWELATALCGGYTCSTDYVTFIPQLNFTQINIFQSSIKENTTELTNLKTASKNFRYLNMSLSLKVEQPVIYSCCCVTPSLQFGWHNTRLLSDKNFTSKLGGHSIRGKNFRTETYSSNTSLYFLEATIGLSDRESNSLELSYKAEFGTNVITSGLSAQIIWEF